MAEYRAIRLSFSQFGWTVQQRRWFGWKTVDSGNSRAEAQEKIDYLEAGLEVIYPTQGIIPRPGDPLGIRSEQE